ncbi:MAG: type II CRISPR-associated endonuclease Cas1, partial [Planctomycetales bacterium]|nr:type II CRISPR-associated endonuclease Cas1 [Planctomycetales bacterium]
ASLISACMDAGIVIVFSDARHTPSGLALPFHRHHRQSAVAAVQLGLNLPLKKRLWQSIVATKIENQAACLEICGKSAEALRAMTKLVASGDPQNVEARAAREYWSLLFPEFIRSDEGDLRNKMLNYGYAVVRASVARALVASGLLPCIGLFHNSATNAFNLADDLVEPFRPIVDRLVFDLSEGGASSTNDLSLEYRQALAAVLNADTLVADEAVTTLIATEKASQSLVRAMESASPALLCLPRM